MIHVRRGAADTSEPHLHELAKKLAAGTAQLVDVREPKEMALGMCGAAIAFPLSEMRSDPPTVPEAIERQRPVYLHCKAREACGGSKGADGLPWLPGGSGDLAERGL